MNLLKQVLAKMLIVSAYLQGKYWHRFSSRTALEQWQNKKVQRFIQKLPQTNYYRTRLIQPAIFQDWRSWPLMDKHEMMTHFDSLNTVGINKEKAFNVAITAEKWRDFLPQINEITIGMSSGTSGHRGLFIVSNKERYQWVGFLLAKILKKSILKPQKIALFLRANSALYESLNNGTIGFSFFDMIIPILNHTTQLNELSPNILIAPPSVLRQLATLKQQNKLTIKPQQIYSVAEVLDPIDVEYIEGAFEQKIGQIYQATEGFLGITCEKGNLHLNEDLLLIEKHYLDSKKQKFNPIITDFSRTSQPILRYKLNDIVTESSDLCPCGSLNQVISMIEGRCDDLVILHSDCSHSDHVTIFPDFIRQAILRSRVDLLEYVVIHDKIGSLQIALRYKDTLNCFNEIQQSICQALWDMAQQQKAQVPLIEFISYPDLDPSNLQKMKRVIRTY